jgi:hypothetical protein
VPLPIPQRPATFLREKHVLELNDLLEGANRMVDPNQPEGAVKADDAALAAAVEGLLNTHEARVLATMGLFIGYICVFFTKIMSFTNMYVGAIAVAGITLLLLLLDRELHIRSRAWWLRAAIVMALSLMLTSPQLYFAWTVSVTEAEVAALAAHERKLRQANAPSQQTAPIGKQPAGQSP